jgi:COP9 signalosome complex subunit 5
MDTTVPGGIVIINAYPLPITGFETRVIADDADTVNFMINLSESLEGKDETIAGWYHSHPFDLGPLSHSFFSSTDLSTQLSWQRSEDPHGNPWIGLVVDPIRSIHKREFAMKTFRAFPPEYESPVSGMCPDGSILNNEKERLEKWGSCWNRYYELKNEFHMSPLANGILGELDKNQGWVNRLLKRGDVEVKEQESGVIDDLAEKINPKSIKGHSDQRVPETSGGVGGTSGESNSAFDKAVDVLEGISRGKVEAVVTAGVRKDIFDKKV